MWALLNDAFSEPEKTDRRLRVVDLIEPITLDVEIQTTSNELPDPKNVGLAVGISFLTHLQVEILEGGSYSKVPKVHHR